MTRQDVSSSPAAWSASDLEGNPHTEPDKAGRVRRMFAAIAGRYDLNNRLHSLGRDQAWRRAAVRLAGVRGTDHVLDAACGTGDLAEAFAAAGPASVTGLDFCEEMLEVAREKAARKGRRRNHPAPRYLPGDVMSLPFDDRAFDVVSIAFGIRNVSDPAIALSQFRRVLRPGGRLVALEFSEPENSLLRPVNRFYCRKIMPATAAMIAQDRMGAYRYLPRSIATFLDREALIEAMREAGFASVEQHPMTFGVCVAYLAVLD